VKEEEYRQKTMETTEAKPQAIYIKYRPSIKSPISIRSFQTPIFPSNPQPWRFFVTSFFNLIWMISPTIFSNLSHTRSSDFSRYTFFIHFLSSWCTITYLNVLPPFTYCPSFPSSPFTHEWSFACPLSKMLTWYWTLVYKYVQIFWCIPQTLSITVFSLLTGGSLVINP